MDPKLTELFNQMKLTFEHFSEAFEQSNTPAMAAVPASEPAVQPGPASAQGTLEDRNEELPENMSEMPDEELNERLTGKKKTAMPKM
jgi:hypothetical protein